MRNTSLPSVILVTFFALALPTAFQISALAQPGGPIGNMFQGPPPPGAISVMGRAFFEAGEAGFGHSFMLLAAVDQPDLRQELGLTDTEINSIQLVRTQMLMNAPQYAQRFNTMTEEDQQSIQADLVRDLGRISQSLNTALPQERKDRLDKLVFQALNGLDSPFTTLSSMEVLNLSEEQRRTMQGIFDDIRPERMSQLETLLSMGEKVTAAGGPHGLSPEEIRELQRTQETIEVQAFETARKLSERLRQHLTPEQLELEKQLVASRPSFLPSMSRRPGRSGENVSEDSYAPGADSWRPGRDVPVDIQAPRPGSFPRPE